MALSGVNPTLWFCEEWSGRHVQQLGKLEQKLVSFATTGPPRLSRLRLMQQSTIDWVAYKLQKCISQSSGGWKSEIMCQHGWVLGRALFGPTDWWLLISTSILIWWKESRPTLWSLIKGLTPFTRAPPLLPSYLPKALLLNIIALNVRISACTFQVTQIFSPLHFWNS